MPASLPHVVILGGGFGGLQAAKSLRKAPVRVTLVDRQNHHLFQPLLYQVATAGLSAPDIAEPIRHILRHQDNARVLLGEARSIDVTARQVHLDHQTLDYDYLVMAVGMTHSYFGQTQWAEHAPGLKTLSEALDMRRRILLAFEAAERSATDRQEHLTFVVVGAGPTGVELAGAVAEIARTTLTRNFHAFDPAQARVVLVDAADRVLSGFHPALSQKAAEQLRDLGVEIKLNVRVTNVTAEGVQLGDELLASRTVLWAAGVQAVPVVGTLGATTDPAGRVKVLPDLSLPEHPEVFVVGDIAHVPYKDSIVPGVAPAATQGGAHAADGIKRRIHRQDTKPFQYKDKGSLATIGRSKAVAHAGPMKLSGYPAWVAWLIIHIWFLVGFENRLVVMIQWAYAWFTWQRGARVIVEVPPMERMAGPEGEEE